jgi:hypothetical protein
MNDKKSPGHGLGMTGLMGQSTRAYVVCRRTKPYGGNNTDFTAAQLSGGGLTKRTLA